VDDPPLCLHASSISSMHPRRSNGCRSRHPLRTGSRRSRAVRNDDRPQPKGFDDL
jgi:hypothetical protein